MSHEDFTTYTNNLGAGVTVTARKVDSVLALPRDQYLNLVKDHGAGNIPVLFKWWFDYRTDPSTPDENPGLWIPFISNSANSPRSTEYGCGMTLLFSGANCYMSASAQHSGGLSRSIYTVSANSGTTYYAEIERHAGGTYGTLTVRWFSDPERLSLITSRAQALFVSSAGPNSHAHAIGTGYDITYGADVWTGTVENLDFEAGQGAEGGGGSILTMGAC